MKNKDYFLPVLLSAVLTAVSAAGAAFLSPYCAAAVFALGAAQTGICAFFAVRRRRKTAELNDYLSRVCGGDYSFDIRSNAEGELSILKNNLYKVIVTLRAQKEELEKDRTYLADSLADISHQLKTPLTSIMMMTDLLREEQDAEKRREFSDVAASQCAKMTWLVGTLLKLSKLDAGTADFSFTDNHIVSTVDESVKPFLLTLDLKNIALERGGRDFVYSGDENWTAEALQNIVKNCIEHTPEGGRLRIETDETSLFRRVVIEDNGSGVAPEDLPHIFERFYHGKDASAESVGIGLSLSKTILKKESASIEAQSEPGKGTRFEIRFYNGAV